MLWEAGHQERLLLTGLQGRQLGLWVQHEVLDFFQLNLVVLTLNDEQRVDDLATFSGAYISGDFLCQLLKLLLGAREVLLDLSIEALGYVVESRDGLLKLLLHILRMVQILLLLELGMHLNEDGMELLVDRGKEEGAELR